MLVLLRQSQTKFYYGVHGDWVSKTSAAAHFETIEEALLANRQSHLEGTEVVVIHSNGHHKVTLPIGKESWATQRWNTLGTAVHSRNPRNSGAFMRGSLHRACRANGPGIANRHPSAAKEATGPTQGMRALAHPSWSNVGPGHRRNQSLLQGLASSRLFQEYARAFTDATGLPVALRPIETWHIPLHGKRGENHFCALMSQTSRTCAICLQAQERLSLAAANQVHTLTCSAGLCETAIPLRLAEQLVGYLQTGQVFLKRPTENQFEHVAARVACCGLEVARSQLRKAYFAARIVPRQKYESAVKMLSIFAQHLSQLGQQLVVFRANEEPPVITRARAYIEEHHTERLRLVQVARAVCLSPFHFCKLFKRALGISFRQYLPRLRIETSKCLLLKSDLKITEIAFASGFESLAHFTRVFKKLVGKSPSAYRAQLPPQECRQIMEPVQ